MCGIVGVYNQNNRAVSLAVIKKATDCITHRGPDFGNVFVDGNVGLGHRRLSIIDLSELANQPMFSDDERYAIVFNGEVYNFQDLREELKGNNISFKTNSDTEVVLKAYIHWGIAAFKKLNGMFAFSIYDKLEKKMVAVRDRFGIKPFYYSYEDNSFIFASEIKAIKEYLSTDGNYVINMQALSEYMWFGNSLGENTIYKSINELLPGSFVVISQKYFSVEKYWHINEIAEDPTINEESAVIKIRKYLDQSVERNLISDVPVGIFLSGGVDSSVITAIASKFYSSKIKTYSVGFDFDKGVNELPKAKRIAQLFGTDHNEIHITAKDLPEIIESLVLAHDEPFADAANIPLYLLTRQVKKEVKVVLQGDGGDELFGGYSRYFTLQKPKYWALWNAISRLPWQLISATRFKQMVRFLDAINESDDAEKMALLLTMETRRDSPLSVLSTAIRNRLANCDPFKRYKELNNLFKNNDIIQRMFYTDLSCVLPDSFLEKVDKSTMANSLEIRVPFLDNNLTNFMLSVPSSLKVKKGIQKYLLKKSYENVLPADILYGPKKGFGVPYSFWIQKPLLEYLRSVVFHPEVRKYQVFDENKLSRIINDHSLNRGNYGFLLWKCLNLSLWLKANKASYE